MILETEIDLYHYHSSYHDQQRDYYGLQGSTAQADSTMIGRIIAVKVTTMTDKDGKNKITTLTRSLGIF